MAHEGSGVRCLEVVYGRRHMNRRMGKVSQSAGEKTKQGRKR